MPSIVFPPWHFKPSAGCRSEGELPRAPRQGDYPEDAPCVKFLDEAASTQMSAGKLL